MTTLSKSCCCCATARPATASAAPVITAAATMPPRIARVRSRIRMLLASLLLLARSCDPGRTAGGRRQGRRFRRLFHDVLELRIHGGGATARGDVRNPVTLVEFVFERMLAGQVRRHGPFFARGDL